MAKYKINYASQYSEYINKFKKAGDKPALKKIDKLLEELKYHPRYGTGKPEQLKGFGTTEVLGTPDYR